MQIHLLDEEVLEAAVTVQCLQQRRANLKGLHHTLQVGLVPCSFCSLWATAISVHPVSATPQAIPPHTLSATCFGNDTTLVLRLPHHVQV